MLFTTLAVTTALCLIVPFARLYGFVGAVILLYFYPYHTLTLLGVLLLAGVIFIYLRRRNSNAL